MDWVSPAFLLERLIEREITKKISYKNFSCQ